MVVKIGEVVRAVVTITESDFNGAAEWIHARPGDLGIVVDVEDGVTVRFQRSGTATLVDELDVIPTAELSAQQAVRESRRS